MKYRYGKIALVVGASSGVGKELSQYLCDEGYIVYGTSRKASYENSDSDGVKMIPLDVTSSSSIKEALDYIINMEGEIGLLINCPGYGLAGAIEDTELDEAREIFDTNFFGIMNTCNQTLPYMRRQGYGLVVNVSSVAGLITIPFQAMYSATKSALESLTEAYRMETEEFGVKFSLILPGDMKTNFYRKLISKYNDSVYNKYCVRAVNKMIEDEKNGSSARVVVRELKYILSRRKPPVRRVVGFEYKVITILRKILPASFVESLVSYIYRGK